jgi:hypothetical protein
MANNVKTNMLDRKEIADMVEENMRLREVLRFECERRHALTIALRNLIEVAGKMDGIETLRIACEEARSHLQNAGCVPRPENAPTPKPKTLESL